MVRTGLQRIADGDSGLSLKGLRCGLLCHAASVCGDLRHAVDVVRDTGARLSRLFGPEHGVFGETQDMVQVDSRCHPRLGLVVHSLYGATLASLKPRGEWLEDLDLVLIDLQDVGSRYYTYVWTMVLMIQACAEAGRRVVVLDRPNPIGGVDLEGPGVDSGYTSFVGLHPVPVRHGMTTGELARLTRAELGLEHEVDLTVVAAQGWRRAMMHESSGLPWVLPSPNMPTPHTALVYPGGCLLEGTNVSEGRGTTRPFEIVGAPWVNGWSLAQELGAADLPGVQFRPLSFVPTFHKYAGQSCGGIQIHVVDSRVFRPLRTFVALLGILHRLWPGEFRWREQPYEFVHNLPAIDLLAGGSWLRQGVEQDLPLDRISAGWSRQERAFDERRRKWLLHD